MSLSNSPRREKFARLTVLSYIVVNGAVVLLLLSIAQIVLEAKLLHAFRDEKVQFPNSSLAEWLFVSMNPPYIDNGPTTAIFAAGACCIFTSLLIIAWVAMMWFPVLNSQTRKLGIFSSIVAFLNAIGSIGFVTFVLVKESRNKLPDNFVRWRETYFTREFYVCDAFPSLFDGADIYTDAESLYGFAACDVSRAAKYILTATTCIAIIVAGVAILQAAQDRGSSISVKKDLEKGTPVKPPTLQGNVYLSRNNLSQPIEGNIGGNNEVQRPRAASLKRGRTVTRYG